MNENHYLFEKMSDCSVAKTWDSMTLTQLQKLEAAGRAVGEKDLWFKVGKKKMTLRAEIARRLEREREVRIALRGPFPDAQL